MVNGLLGSFCSYKWVWRRGENSKIIHTKLLFGLLGRISAKFSTNRIKKARDGCFRHYIQVKVVKCQNESFKLSEVCRKLMPKRTTPVRLTVPL